MKKLQGISLGDVQRVYGGPEGRLWELVMGEQIHLGGFAASMDLAERAGIGAGMTGIDLCCCSGAGMRFLVKFRQVRRMTGVDATGAMLKLGKKRNREMKLQGKISFRQADVCRSGLPAGKVDFVWGEDAWCYVGDKKKLIAEAVRLVKSGGIIAFTDWVEGVGLKAAEAARFMRFMKFPSILTRREYAQLMTDNHCEIIHCEDTGRFPGHAAMYLDMLGKQLTYDALRIIGFDTDLMGRMAEEMKFMLQLARRKKIAQGLLVARKKSS